MANLPGRLKPRQRGIRVARMSCSAAQSTLAPACPAAQRIAMFFTNDLRRMPVLVLEIPGDTTTTICLRRWSYLEFMVAHSLRQHVRGDGKSGAGPDLLDLFVLVQGLAVRAHAIDGAHLSVLELHHVVVVHALQCGPTHL